MAPLDLAPLSELLSAPSKQAVDDFFCACAREREEPAAPSAARTSELATLFGLTEPQAIAMQRAGAGLIGEATFTATTVEQVGALFPEDFQPQLKGLILRVFEHRMDDWRCDAARLELARAHACPPRPHAVSQLPPSLPFA